MKKAFVILLGFVVVISLAAILFWNIFPSFLSHQLSKQAGVSVTIADVHLSPKQINIDGIKVENPSTYSKTDHALSVDAIDVHVPLTRFLDKQIVIDELAMNTVYIGLEFDSPTSKNGNWTTIMNHISQSTEKERDQAQPKEETTSVLIKKLVITDLQIELAYKTGNKPNKKLRPIDRLELTNISSEGGIPTAQIMNIIMQETLRNIFSKEGLQNMLDGIANPQDTSESVIDAFKSLFSK